MKWYEIIDVVALATVVAIVLIVGISLGVLKGEAKDIALASSGVLGGFLTKGALDRIREK